MKTQIDLRVLQILPNLNRGGAEKVVLKLLNSTPNSSYQSVLLTMSSFSPDEEYHLDKDISRITILKKKRNHIIHYLTSFFWIARNRDFFRNFDVIHAHLTFGAFVVYTIRFLSRLNFLSKPKLIFTYHLSGMHVSKLVKYFQIFSLFFVEFFVLVSQENVAFFDSTKLWNKKVRIIPNGTEFSAKVHSGENLARRNIPQCDKVQVIATMTRLNSDRSPILFLDLFQQISEFGDGNKFRFVIGGHGPMLSELQRKSELKGLGDSLTFSGMITDIDYFFRGVDLYVSLVVGTYPGMAGLEAIARGVPIVGLALDVPYKPQHDFPIPTFSNVKSLAQYIVRFRESSTDANHISLSQFDWAAANYSADMMCLSYAELYGNYRKSV